MYVLDTLNEISFYRVGLIFKYAVNIVCIVVPLIITIYSMHDLYQIISKPDEAKTQVKKVFDRIIAGLIVFIIPSIIKYSMTLIDDYKPDTLLKYYNGASKQKIEQLEIQYTKEEKALANKKEAEYKEAGKRIQNEEAKLKQQKEEIFREWQDKNKKENENNEPSNGNTSSGNNSSSGGNNSSGGSSSSGNNSSSGESSYSGDSTKEGKYGSVTVSNGVFTIPNRRATSDSDIPKQSGQYGLNPVFWERLSKFIQNGSKAGYKITVSSGWRSYSSQRSLWDSSARPCSERSRWVACPGGSRHGFGIAADLKFNGTGCSGEWDCNAAAKWAHANAGKYGLKFRMSWEPWHIEPVQVNGGSFGSCEAKC